MQGTHLRAASVVALLALLLAAAPVGAATVPGGVLEDAVVTVTVTNASDGTPVAGATVQLEAHLADEILMAWYDTSAADGTVTFEGVWRPDAGGPALDWYAVAFWSQSRYGADAGLADNCRVTDSIYGTTTVPAAEGPAAIAIAGDFLSSPTCGPTVHGTVLDGDGEPFAVAQAEVTATDEEGHEWLLPFEVEADGAFTAMAPPVFNVVFNVRGADTRDQVEGGCTYTYRFFATATVRADPESDVNLVGQERRVAGSCTTNPTPTATAAATQTPVGVSATPPLTGGGGPVVTPPATDAPVGQPAGSTSAAIVLALIAIASVVLVASAVPSRRRGVRRTP